jgi:hypothetical protein
VLSCHPGELLTMLSLPLNMFMPCRRAVGEGVISVRSSLSKAYDQVDWGFIQRVMEKLGFHSRFVQCVMACVSSVRYSIRFDGTALSPFHPSRGLR